MPRVSLVVPVYNVERYLAACVDSIRNQSLADIEIICVNDGSPDRSPALLRMLASVDDRIKVIDKPNGGLSSARNAGLRAATGDYVLFVDSDDYLETKTCATIVKAFEKTGAEVVTFGANIVPKSAATRWLKRTLSPRKVVYDGFEPALLFKESSRPFVWRSAFTRDFLEREQLEFDESVLFGEDQVFYFAAYPVSRRTALIKDKLYNYRVARPDSLMVSRFSARKQMLTEHLNIAEVICRLWRERGWLGRYQVAMFEWVIEFLGLDAVAKPGEFATQLQVSLAKMLLEYFPAGPWLDELSGPARMLYKRFTNPGGPVKAFLTQPLLVVWGLRRQPLHTTVGLVVRAWLSWPSVKFRGLIRRIVPPTGQALALGLHDLRQQTEDDTQRTLALRLLHMEWIEKLQRERTEQPADLDSAG